MLKFQMNFFTVNANVPSPQVHSQLFLRATSALFSSAETEEPTSFTIYVPQNRGDRTKSKLKGTVYK